MPYSNCCGAYTNMEEYGICPECKEHTDFHANEDWDWDDEETLVVPVRKIQPKKIFNHLMYASYSANRSYGMTHEAAVRIGIGNDEFKAKYESDKA